MQDSILGSRKIQQWTIRQNSWTYIIYSLVASFWALDSSLSKQACFIRPIWVNESFV